MDSSQRKKFYCNEREASLKRIISIQECLSSKDFKADCLLIIAGIDSKFNIGCKNAIETILPGFSIKATKLFTSSESVSEDALDDLVICIKSESIHAYCNPENYDLLMSYAASWQNLVVHCLDKSEYENHEDVSEELKISVLVKMVADCSCVAVPYNFGLALKYQTISFDPMLIEKWPLIQAYGLEEIGGGGFFTMVHEVVDATAMLKEAFALFDPLGLELLLTQHLPQFEKQWKSLIDIVSMVCEQNAGNLEKSMVEEPLKTYFHHAASDNDKTIASEPSVNLGIYTTNKKLKESIEDKSALKNSGIDGSHAYHMVCEGTDSKGVVSCTRTYFFGSGDDDDDLLKKDVRLLEDLYLIAANAFDVALDEYKKSHDFGKCKDVITQYILTTSKDKNYGFIPKGSDIEVTWKAVNQNGSETNSVTGTSNNIRIAIHNIPSFKHLGKPMGSICFSDTFMTSAIQLMTAKESECLLLTRGISRFMNWPISKNDWIKKELDSAVKEKHSDAMNGRCLIENTTAILIHGRWPTFRTDEVAFYGFENCLILHHKQSGYISLPCDLIDSWTMFDNDSTRSITLLTIKPRQKLLSSLPFWLSNEGRVTLAFLPRSKAHAGFYDKAYQVWKDRKEIPLKSLNELKTDEKIIYDCVEEQFKVLDEKQLPFARELKIFPTLNKFFKHFEVSSHASEPLKENELRRILMDNEIVAEEQQFTDESELVLTILTGLPGSGTEALSKALISLARETNRWLAIKVPQEIKDPFNPESFQDQLSLTYRNLTQQKGRPQASSRKQRRLIIQTQGFVDIRDVIHAIEGHPDPVIQHKLMIGSVTCCINPNNLYICGRMHLPLLLEQCRSGFVNNALFTSCIEQDKADILSSCQRLIRQCNPEISFLIAKGGEISRTPDVELVLSDSAFSEQKFLKARNIFPGKRNDTARPPVCQISVSFNRPLDKARFVNNLREMKGKLEAGCQLKDVILWMEGRVSMADFPDIYDFKWSRLLGLTSFSVASNQLSPRPPPSRNTSMADSQGDGSNCITVFGLQLNLENLTELIKSWTRQPKPLLKRNDVSKDKQNELEICHKSDPLPPGWFYNGSQYVSFDGQKLFAHPLLNSYVDDYLAKINKDIQSYNDDLAKEDAFKLVAI